MASTMRCLFFIIGAALIAVAMGIPEGLPVHSASAKSTMPYMAYWLISQFEAWGGKYLVAAVGAGLVLLSVVLPRNRLHLLLALN